LGTCLHTCDGPGQTDGVHVGFQNLLLGVPVGKTNGTEDLPDLTHCIHIVIVGQVFDQLLLQSGSTLPGIKELDGSIFVDEGCDGTLEVYAPPFLIEVLILSTDNGPLQVLGHFTLIHPDTLVISAEGAVLVTVPVI